MADAEPPGDEELARALAEELRRLRVEDVLVQTLVTLSTVGYRRLGTSEETRADRDLDQTRLAIETMRALAPVLGQVLPAELVSQFEEQVAGLQLAYARAVSEGPAPDAADGG